MDELHIGSYNEYSRGYIQSYFTKCYTTIDVLAGVGIDVEERPGKKRYIVEVIRRRMITIL